MAVDDVDAVTGNDRGFGWAAEAWTRRAAPVVQPWAVVRLKLVVQERDDFELGQAVRPRAKVRNRGWSKK